MRDFPSRVLRCRHFAWKRRISEPVSPLFAALAPIFVPYSPLRGAKNLDLAWGENPRIQQVGAREPAFHREKVG